MSPDEVEAILSNATKPYRVKFTGGDEWLLSNFSVFGTDADGARRINALIISSVVTASARQRELLAPGTAMEFDARDVTELTGH